MSSEKDKENNLLWMYKNTNIVDAEEYLLGRPVDKYLEEMLLKKKMETNYFTQPKNHIENECIPPSIRDLKNLESMEHVDLAKKLREDPLNTINHRKEETKRKVLENLLLLKKLQDISKGKNRENQKISCNYEELKTALLVRHSKLITQFGYESLSAEHTLNFVIGKKIVYLLEKYSVNFKIILNIFSKVLKNSKISNNSDKRKKKRKHNSHKRYSSDIKAETSKKNYKYSTKTYRNIKTTKKSETITEKKRKHFKTLARKDKSDSESTSHNDENKDEIKHRISKRRYSEISVSSKKKRKHFNESNNTPTSSSSSSTSSDSETEKDSEDGKHSQVKQHTGFRQPNETKILQTIKQKHTNKAELLNAKNDTPQTRNTLKKPFTDEEVKTLRNIMIRNAKWQDVEKEKNIRKYKAEKNNELKPEYSEEFITKELIKSLNNTTLESRINSNMKNIHRHL